MAQGLHFGSAQGPQSCLSCSAGVCHAPAWLQMLLFLICGLMSQPSPSPGGSLKPRARAAPQPALLPGWGCGKALGSPWCPGPKAAASPHCAPKSYFVGKQQKCLFEPLSILIAGVFVGSKLQPTSSCVGEVIASFVLMCAW